MSDYVFSIGVMDETRTQLDKIIANIQQAGTSAQKTSATIMNTVSDSYSAAVRRSVVSGSSMKDALLSAYKSLVSESQAIGEQMNATLTEALSQPIDTQAVTATIDALKAKLKELQDSEGAGLSDQAYNDAVSELASSIGVLEGAVSVASTRFVDINKEMETNHKLMLDMKLRGEENTAEYQRLAQENANFQRVLDETNTSLTNMSQSGQALNSIVNAFQLLSGVASTAMGAMSMFGASEEEVARQQQKLQSVMAVAVGVQNVYNSLQSKSVLVSAAYALKAKASALALQLQAKNTKLATVAMKALNVVAKANPYTLLAIAIGSVVGAFALLYKRANLVSKELQRVGSAMSSATSGASVEINHLKELTSALQNAQKGSQEYLTIRQSILKQYGSYLPNLAEELDSVDGLSACYDKLAQSISNTFKQRSYFEGMKSAQEDFTKSVTASLSKIQQRLIGTFGEEEGMRLMQQFNKSLEMGDVETKVTTILGSANQLKRRDIEVAIKGIEQEDLAKLQRCGEDINEIVKAKKELTKQEGLMRNFLGIDLTAVENEANAAQTTMKDLGEALRKIYQQIATDTLNIQKQQTKDKIKQLQIERTQALKALEEEQLAFVKQYGDSDAVQKAFAQKKYVIDLQYDTNLQAVRAELEAFLKEVQSKSTDADSVLVQLDSAASKINAQLGNLVPLQQRLDYMQRLLDIDKERLRITYEQGVAQLSEQQQKDVESAKNLGASEAEVQKINETYDGERLLLAQQYQAQLSELEAQATANILQTKLTAYEQYVTRKFQIEEQYERDLKALEESRANGEVSQADYETRKGALAESKKMEINAVAMDTLGEMDSSFEETIASLTGEVLQKSLEELKEFIPQLQKQLQQAKQDGQDTSAIQTQLQSAQKRLSSLQTTTTSKGESGSKKLTKRTQTYIEALKLAQDEVKTLADIFGDDLNDAQKSMLEGTQDLVAGIAMLGLGIQAAVEAEVQAERSSVILTIISAALAVLNATIKIFKQLFAQDSLRAESAIDSNTAKVKRLQTALKLLEVQQKSLVGTEYWKSQYDAIDNVTKQIDLYKKNMEIAQRQAKNATKKRDRDKWESRYQDAVSDYASAVDELASKQDELFETLSGFNFSSFTESLADSILDGFENGLDGGRDAWDDAIDDMLADMVKAQMLTGLQDMYEGVFKNLRAKYNLDDEKTKLSEEELHEFAEEVKAVKENSTEWLEQYKQIYEELGLNQSDQIEATTGAFESMSQDTADELNARFTALQIEGSNLVTMMQQQMPYFETYSYGLQNVDEAVRDLPLYLRTFQTNIASMESLARTQSDRLTVIASNTESIAIDTKWLREIYNKL